MINTERLRKLADFLYDLPRGNFDFISVRCETGCGTVGCAIGWAPSVFPDLVTVARDRDHENNTGVTSTQKLATQCGGQISSNYVTVGAQLFDLPRHISQDLFTPGRALDDGQDGLPGNAGPREVAERLRRFADWADSQNGAPA